jgi:hypothetical protein
VLGRRAPEPGNDDNDQSNNDEYWNEFRQSAIDAWNTRAALPSVLPIVVPNIYDELDSTTMGKVFFLREKGMTPVGVVMIDVAGKRATIDMGKVTWSDASVINCGTIPDDWQLVPKEPTREMQRAAFKLPERIDIGDEWRVMLAAAPSPIPIILVSEWISYDELDTN